MRCNVAVYLKTSSVDITHEFHVFVVTDLSITIDVHLCQDSLNFIIVESNIESEKTSTHFVGSDEAIVVSIELMKSRLCFEQLVWTKAIEIGR